MSGRFNHRVFTQLRRIWRLLVVPRLWQYIKEVPHPAYCRRCNAWTWCTYEVPALSTRTLPICHECADENDKDCDAAWRALH